MLQRLWRAIATALMFLGAVLLLWVTVVWQPSSPVAQLTFLNVGQGDAVLLETPAGHTLLIDGGPDNTVLRALGRQLPWWQRRLSAVYLTHPHEDHLFGLIEIARRYQPEVVFVGSQTSSEPLYQAWLRMAEPQTIHAGQRWLLGDGSYLEVLSAGLTGKTANDNSLVLKFVFGDFSALLVGDLSVAGETALLNGDLDVSADVLKIGHHGAAEATSEKWLAAVQPQAAIISVGSNNRYGHPSPRTLNRLTRQGVSIYRTDQSGDIKIVSDGRDFTIK